MRGVLQGPGSGDRSGDSSGDGGGDDTCRQQGSLLEDPDKALGELAVELARWKWLPHERLASGPMTALSRPRVHHGAGLGTALLRGPDSVDDTMTDAWDGTRDIVSDEWDSDEWDKGDRVAVRSRLVARRHVLIMQGLPLLAAALYAAMALLESGTVPLAAWAVVVAALLVWGAVIRTTLISRRLRPVRQQTDGSVVEEAPAALVALLLAAWAAMLVAVVAWVVVAATDFASIESPGGLLLVLVGGLGSLPDLVRLATGRLHRWKVVADDDGIRYRGYHTDRVLAWSEISTIRSQQKPLGVVVEQKGDGGRALVLPGLAFDVHPDAIADALKDRRRRSKRR